LRNGGNLQAFFRAPLPAEVQISKMPLVELSSQFTTYSLSVAMSLKSKWSQRMYELCQKWQGTDGFRISVEDLRKTLF
jgi:plasmid replication initiation protein